VSVLARDTPRRPAHQRHRSRLRGGEREKFLDSDIFDRDNWICQI
jgi:hypothetical protein